MRSHYTFRELLNFLEMYPEQATTDEVKCLVDTINDLLAELECVELHNIYDIADEVRKSLNEAAEMQYERNDAIEESEKLQQEVDRLTRIIRGYQFEQLSSHGNRSIDILRSSLVEVNNDLEDQKKRHTTLLHKYDELERENASLQSKLDTWTVLAT